MNFQYEAKRLSGERLKGKIDADNKTEALRELEKEGYIIYHIEETKPWNKDLAFHRKIKNKDFVIFLRQYATLIQSGIPIATATNTMAQQTNIYMLKIALEDIYKRLRQGQSLSSSAMIHPTIFPELLISMIEAGEASGKLDDILGQMATYYEKQYTNRQKILSALMYPTIVGIITFVLVVFLLIFVVPQFVSMFNSFDQELPFYTKLIVNLSQWAGNYWWIFFVFLLLLVVFYQRAMKNGSFAYKMDVIKMKIPIFGQLVYKGAFVRATQTLSTLFYSGVPILQAVEITEKVVGNRVIRGIFVQSRNALTSGKSMTTPMQGHWAFPTLVVQMIQIGEQTGTLDSMLLKVAHFYEEEVEHLSERIKTMIEPLIIVVLAVVVGGIILAIVLPMFSMFENFI
ncbi:type II secretion system F family protein [Virgibacillus sp. W0430]|uniref:type II secretion system F family protein n=1 Tax=Virgibacillus sp. W0430 TaxID=3391580 RepID=UPI003F4847D0